MRTRSVEGGIAGRADMDHRRHIQLAKLLVKFVPVAVGQRRRGPASAGRIGIQVAADKAKLVHAARKLLDAVLRTNARGLRQLADADEVVGKERADAMDTVVGRARPFEADLAVADMMAHARSARREERQRGAALALDAELIALDARAEFVVADLDRTERRQRLLVPEGGDLLLTEIHQRLGFGRVMAVAVDDHGFPRYSAALAAFFI